MNTEAEVLMKTTCSGELRFAKTARIPVAPNFYSNEFNCPCDKCETTIIDPALPEKLQALRDLIGLRVNISSGYRCADYQDTLKRRGYETAKGVSQHELGRAADLFVIRSLRHVSGSELEHYARKAGFKAIGVGVSWVHVDLREGDKKWFYKS